MRKNFIEKHPAFINLLDKVREYQSAEKYLPLVEISGVTYDLYKPLVESLAGKLNKAIIAIYRDDQELRRYLESALIVELAKTSSTTLLKYLGDYGYSKTDKVDSLTEYSIKGDTLSFWPPGFAHPIRLSYFDGELESAKLYDEIYGKSFEDVKSFLLGDLNKIESRSQLDYINVSEPDKYIANCVIVFGGDNLDNLDSGSDVSFDFVYPQLYFNRFDILTKEISRLSSTDYDIKLFTTHKDKLPKNLQKYVSSSDRFESGLESKTLKILHLTDKELFGTVFLGSETKKLSTERARKILANLEGEIGIGDYIVHQEHGIGIYQGIKQEEYVKELKVGLGERKKQIIKEDYVLIGYAEKDELFVPLRQIDKLTKYISIDDQDPELTRLGKTDWTAIRSKTKESVFELAKELVEHYAKRELAKASKVEHGVSEAYEKFVNDFEYKETPDQLQTEKEVLTDMSKTTPMNRLIVGDVGFGKTEVAMRAAFKAVENGFQVSVLCPTTVLAAQHEKVFNERFRNTNIQIGSFSRLNKSKEKQNLVDLEKGKLDIVIGTHRLLSKDIKFKNLGLIVVDEEQKFGVKQKESLKKLEYGVHVLSMSATPIPRSLSMALSSIQDISIIQTAPENRKAVKNIVTPANDSKIKVAIENEIKRGGQIYFVYNIVKTIESQAAKLRKLLPDLKLIVAHGQMKPETLNNNVEDFYNGKYDLLLCTTIIENGLDMPNVNTIIINNAQNFGLGQLYQLRGRVGRSEKQAYAYFFYDGEDIDEDDTKRELQLESQTDLTKLRNMRKYKKRLQAIKETDELGAGFKLASRDLEIRGAGNLLGKQQHGNIKQIGYALYMQMLAEEIEKLKSISEQNE